MYFAMQGDLTLGSRSLLNALITRECAKSSKTSQCLNNLDKIKVITCFKLVYNASTKSSRDKIHACFLLFQEIFVNWTLIDSIN